jgi:hypothetical protein
VRTALSVSRFKVPIFEFELWTSNRVRPNTFLHSNPLRRHRERTRGAQRNVLKNRGMVPQLHVLAASELVSEFVSSGSRRSCYPAALLGRYPRRRPPVFVRVAAFHAPPPPFAPRQRAADGPPSYSPPDACVRAQVDHRARAPAARALADYLWLEVGQVERTLFDATAGA